MLGPRLQLLTLLALSAAPAFGRGVEFDSKDPVAWAVHRLKESPDGPRLKLWEPKRPAAEPPRAADGALRDPKRAFPDSQESDEVLRRVRAFLSLGPDSGPERSQRAFASVAEAAEAWARRWTGRIPAGLDRREARRWVMALGMRMIANPAVPRFSEFVDPKLDENVAAEVDYTRGWKRKDEGGAWRYGRGGQPLSIAYNGDPRNSLRFELTRIHEWVHIVDSARTGEVDAQGRFVREQPEAENGLFTESKAYALDFVLQKAFLADDPEMDLPILAAELEKAVEDVTLEEYLASQFSGGGVYPWAVGIRPTGLKTRIRELMANAWYGLKERVRALRGNELVYLRTIDP